MQVISKVLQDLGRLISTESHHKCAWRCHIEGCDIHALILIDGNLNNEVSLHRIDHVAFLVDHHTVWIKSISLVLDCALRGETILLRPQSVRCLASSSSLSEVILWLLTRSVEVVITNELTLGIKWLTIFELAIFRVRLTLVETNLLVSIASLVFRVHRSLTNFALLFID